MGNNNVKQQYIADIKNNKYHDSYKLFKLSPNFTWDELKKSYKNLAIKCHPDKGGDKIIFDYVTTLFYKLSDEYKLRTSNKNFNELKQDFIEYSNKNNSSQNNNIIDNKYDDNLSFNERLNKHFNQVKIYDEDIDNGYGELMEESTDVRDDIKINNLFNSTKINSKTFNQTFNNNISNKKDIIKYKDPQPMILAKNLNFSEIGSGKNNDYSSSMEKSNVLQYTDYLKAHSTNYLVNSSQLNNFKTFKNTTEYKKYSDKKIKDVLTEKELKHIEKNKKKEAKEEKERLKRIQEKNIKITEAYNIANQLFIK